MTMIKKSVVRVAPKQNLILIYVQMPKTIALRKYWLELSHNYYLGWFEILIQCRLTKSKNHVNPNK